MKSFESEPNLLHMEAGDVEQLSRVDALSIESGSRSAKLNF